MNGAIIEFISRGIEDRTERIAAVDAFISTLDMRPQPDDLARLADYILREELTDTHPDKVTRAEYPFFSEHQLERRRNNEVPLEVASEYGTDGRNYRVPKRRKRTTYEMIHVDEHARIRNKDRAAQYRRETSAGPLVTYNLRDNGGELAPDFVTAATTAEVWRERLSLVY